MHIGRISMVLSFVFLLTGCSEDRNQCKTELDYVVNQYTSGEAALRHSSEYRINLTMGADDFSISALLDTAHANLIVNEKDYDYGIGTALGKKPFPVGRFDVDVGINAKDTVDVACSENYPAKFTLLKEESNTHNILGLAYSDPARNSHEKFSPAFFDQLVKEGFKNSFSLSLCGFSGKSHILLGGYDEKMESLLGNFIPIIEKSAYVVRAIDLRRADTKEILGEFPHYDPANKEGVRTILDSASAFLLLPEDMATRIANLVKDEAHKLDIGPYFPDGFFRTERAASIKLIRFSHPLQIRQFPSLEINFRGKDGTPKSLDLAPEYYFKAMDEKDPMLRTFAVRETRDDVVLGQPFLENHYLYIDRGKALIGFANNKIACAP